MIDYILQTTQQKKLSYIGYSQVGKLNFQCTQCFYLKLLQGATIFYVMASQHPEYNSKISLAQTLVGAAFMEGSTFPMVFERYLRRIEVRLEFD
jgi:surfactin synthase thioesterase subunit